MESCAEGMRVAGSPVVEALENEPKALGFTSNREYTQCYFNCEESGGDFSCQFPGQIP